MQKSAFDRVNDFCMIKVKNGDMNFTVKLPSHCCDVTIKCTEKQVDNILGLRLYGPTPGIIFLAGVFQIVVVVEIKVGNQFLKENYPF